jgi:crossover junction endodeoxyribonuclease RusA
MSTIDLPLPPSVNRLWRSNRGRVHRAPLSFVAQGRGLELVTQRPERLAGSVRVNISVGRPDRRRRDVDNLG